MEVIYSLIPGMTFFGLLFVAILIWAVRKGQYEDMEGNASRILLDDDEDALLASCPEKKVQQEKAPSAQDGKPPAAAP
ncbi:MAG: cbb3-type cytochrome oxidase assembly protein CcoS [Nitrosomonadales bacterium]|nr:cbb3-type cytochrome oxidase assembly protein CcoS [Nitrosomonadales bacterium]